MSELESRDAEAPALYSEPLLPIEKKLIGYSFGLGIVLLVVLVTINHLFPVKL